MRFQRTKGAAADVKELEYVAALLQTCMPETRANGTVSSVDLQRLLCSRYGFTGLKHPKVIEMVRAFAGDDMTSRAARIRHESIVEKQGKPSAAGRLHKSLRKSLQPYQEKKDDLTPADDYDDKEDENDKEDVGSESDKEGEPEEEDELDESELLEEYLDIVQILATLLIPNLASAAHDFRNQTEHVSPPDSSLPSEPKVAANDDNVAKEQSLLYPPENLFQGALKMLLASLSQYHQDSESPPIVHTDLVESLLWEFGEHERAQDFDLVHEMVDAASSVSGTLDEEALVNALTYDLQDWKVGQEDRLSTFFYDVYGFELGQKDPTATKASSQAQVEEQEDINKFDAQKVDKDEFDYERDRVDHTNIDFVVDSHSSVSLVVLIWVFYLFIALSYGTLAQSLVNPPCIIESSTSPGAFGCQLAVALWTW